MAHTGIRIVDILSRYQRYTDTRMCGGRLPDGEFRGHVLNRPGPVPILASCRWALWPIDDARLGLWKAFDNIAYMEKTSFKPWILYKFFLWDNWQFTASIICLAAIELDTSTKRTSHQGTDGTSQFGLKASTRLNELAVRTGKKTERSSGSGIIWAKGFVKFSWSCFFFTLTTDHKRRFARCFPPSLGTFMNFIFLLCLCMPIRVHDKQFTLVLAVLRPAAKALKAVLLASWLCWGNHRNKKHPDTNMYEGAVENMYCILLYRV